MRQLSGGCWHLPDSFPLSRCGGGVGDDGSGGEVAATVTMVVV